jgi:hypothetical protein
MSFIMLNNGFREYYGTCISPEEKSAEHKIICNKSNKM